MKTMLVTFYQKFMEKESLVDNEVKNLIHGCINGNHKSQTLLYKKYYNTIFGVCLKIIKNRPLAEDLSQDIFIKLVKKLDKFNGDNFAQLSSWVARLTKNHTIDFIRSRKITENIENVSLNLFTEIIDLSAMDNSEEIMANDIKNAISVLPLQYKRVFELFYISNYSHQEIADELNLNVGTSKSNLFKAKKKLASALSQYNNKFN
jgi:RNA polymerase sigma factor (sigma-70 family)